MVDATAGTATATRCLWQRSGTLGRRRAIWHHCGACLRTSTAGHGGGCVGVNVIAWRAVSRGSACQHARWWCRLHARAPTFVQGPLRLGSRQGSCRQHIPLSSVKLAADGDSLKCPLRGKPGEEVALLFAVSSVAAEYAGGSNTSGYTYHAVSTVIMMAQYSQHWIGMPSR